MEELKQVFVPPRILRRRGKDWMGKLEPLAVGEHLICPRNTKINTASVVANRAARTFMGRKYACRTDSNGTIRIYRTL